MNKNNPIFDNIDVLNDMDRSGYVELKIKGWEAETPKAILLKFQLAPELVVSRWCPYSQLRCTEDGKVLIAEWLYKKIQSEEL